MHAISGTMTESSVSTVSTAAKYLDRYFVPLSICVLIAFPLVWIWKHEFLPLQDFPINLAHSYIVSRYHATPFFKQHCTLTFLPYPYLMQDAVMCSTMFLGYRVAGKIMLSVLLCVFLFGHAYFLRIVNREHNYVTLFAVPLFWNKFFFKGGYNYLFGLSFALICIAMLYKIWSNRDRRRDSFLFPLACVLLYCSHPVALALFFAAAVPFLLSFIWRRDWRKLLKSGRALLLPLFLLAAFMSMQRVDAPAGKRRMVIPTSIEEVITVENVKGKYGEIRQLMTNYSPQEWNIMLPCLALGLLLMGGGCIQWRKKWPMLTVLGIYAAAYFLFPRSIHELVRPHERVLFMMLFVAPSCMGFPEYIGGKRVASPREQKLLVAAVGIVTALRLDMHIEKVSTEIEPIIKDSHAMMTALPPNGTLLSVNISSPFYGQIGFGNHVICYYVAERDGMVPNVFTPSYLMVGYRHEGPLTMNWQQTPPEGYSFYDFIFVWGDNPSVEALMKMQGFRCRERKSFMAMYERIDSPILAAPAPR